MLLVSACLLGVDCKYNGENNAHQGIRDRVKFGRIIPICPEQLGGLKTPRPPAEIQGGSGEKVLSFKADLKTLEGLNVTEAFLRGAKETLSLAKTFNVHGALLKERSPSCGSSFIYDGTFSQTLIPGEGVTAALLRREGYEVFSEMEWERMKSYSLPGRERIYLGVIGASQASDEILSLAYRTGELIALNKAVLLCGGRGGVMEAAARGTQARGGMTLGILPGPAKEEGNTALTISLATGLGDARNALIARGADAFIAIGGSYGTLSEIGLALKMGKRVVGLKTWSIAAYDGGDGGIETASTPEEAVSILLEEMRY